MVLYRIVKTRRGNRLEIRRADGSRVFSLKTTDERFAKEILANLNARPA